MAAVRRADHVECGVWVRLSAEIVASAQWALDNQSWPTTLWATNATISAAIQSGPISGMLAGAAVMAASTVVKGFINYDLGRNATIVIELARSESGCRARCMTARSRCSRCFRAGYARLPEKQDQLV
jgi:hypothetical protein